MRSMLDPNRPAELDTLEDLLTIVTFLRSKLQPHDCREDLRLLDQAALRCCFLLVNHENIAPDRARQIRGLQLSLSQRLRRDPPQLHPLAGHLPRL